MPTDALPAHLSRRQQDGVWGNTDPIGSFLDFLDGIPAWVWGGGAVGTARELDASELPDSSLMTEEQPLVGIKSPGLTRVPATQPPEDPSFYGVPKQVGDAASNVNVPATQPDLGTVWVPKSRSGGP